MCVCVCDGNVHVHVYAYTCACVSECHICVVETTPTFTHPAHSLRATLHTTEQSLEKLLKEEGGQVDRWARIMAATPHTLLPAVSPYLLLQELGEEPRDQVCPGS